MPVYHDSALLELTVKLLQPSRGRILVDGTLGGGGHSVEIAKRQPPDGMLIGIDQDPQAIEECRRRLADAPVQVKLLQGNFRNMRSLLQGIGVHQVWGILLDLGVSSHMLDTAERGFSFRMDATLDMRMNQEVGETAASLLARISEDELRKILYEYGEERWGAIIARRIVEARQSEPISTTVQLAEIVKRAIPYKAQSRDIHPATLVFQSLRIYLNDEIGALRQFLEDCTDLLEPGGRVIIISYHSLEDRLVKRSFLRDSGRCICPPGLPVCECGATKKLHILTKKPIVPDMHARDENIRVRSAKLRCAEKIDNTFDC